MRGHNPSAVLNFRKPSMHLEMGNDGSPINETGELRFIRYFSLFGKVSTAACQVNEKPEPDGLWFALSSGEKIRTSDLRVMSYRNKKYLQK